MTETQNGQGATPERLSKSKFETIETINAGQFAQRNVWPDIVAWLLDRAMLLEDDGYAWSSFCQLKAGRAGSGNGGDGEKYMEWIRFGKLLGNARLSVLEILWEWPIPKSDNNKETADALWRLNRCLPRIKDALSGVERASQDAREGAGRQITTPKV